MKPDRAQPPASASAVPYVGLRPYEREERNIFFGRDRDAKFLCDKIFSARLTFLYAQSGLGKSSILRTLVIPLLEDEHARTVYFDNWTGRDPASALKAVLIRTAAHLKIPDAGAGSPSLKQLAALIASADDRTVVLILDQFEEFLIHGHLDPLRKELGELIRAAGIDVRVVVSLRQEFLAGLEPFREEILNLFQSTHLLDALDENGIREAIELPAKKFGASYEPALVDLLIKDLRTQQDSESFTSPGGTSIDLPTMQLVCTQLWEQAQRRGQTILTCTLYDELGGAARILDTYVNSVMPKRSADQYVTAKLMKSLAPSSGLKKPFSADELANAEELDKTRVQKELKRLEAHRILRTREFRGNELFELQHDAFIRIIAPWRDSRLQHLKRMRQATWAAGAAAVIVAILITVLLMHRHDYYLHTDGAFTELQLTPAKRRNAEAVFDGAARYLLFQRTESGRFDKLKQLLQQKHALQPSGYGMDQSNVAVCDAGSDTVSSQSASQIPDDWPLTLHYSSLRKLDKCYFDHVWGSLAASFTAELGVPVPLRLKLVEESTYPKRLMSLIDGGRTALQLQVDTYDDKAYIALNELPAAAADFRKRFESEMIKVPAAKDTWIVPRWSLPVWKVSGLLAEDTRGYPAFVIANEMRRRPELLLPESAVTALLRNVQQTYPDTVRQALASRGATLRSDLIELLRLGRSLVGLPTILDTLADHPAGTSKAVAAQANRELNGVLAQLPARLHGPWKDVPNLEKQTSAAEKLEKPYEEAVQKLPLQPSIRVYVGRSLELAWRDGSGLKPALAERIETWRDNFYRQFGITLQGVRFIPDSSLDSNAFRIEMLNQTAASPGAQPVSTSPGSALDTLTDALDLRAESLRTRWVNPDSFFEFAQVVDRPVQAWLNQWYSLTDLKLLLRAALRPPAEAPTGKQHAAVSPEQSLRHLNWLLASLVFWSQLDDPADLPRMAADLQNTQRARLTSVPPPRGQEPTEEITQGIKALESRRYEAAQAMFSQALRIDREQAMQSFLAAYPQALQDELIGNFEGACKDLTHVSLTRSSRVDLWDVIDGLGKGADTERARRLDACLVQAWPSNLPRERKDLEAQSLSRYGSPDEWLPQEAELVALAALRDYDPITDNPATREKAGAFLKSAMRRDLKTSMDTFTEVEKIALKPGPTNWCWKLLDELSKMPEADPSVRLDLMAQLSQHERREDLERALQLADDVEKTMPRTLPAAERAQWLQWVAYSRASALTGLSELRVGDYWADAEKLYGGLQNSPSVGAQSTQNLAQLKQEQGQYTQADEILKAALQKKNWRLVPDLLSQKLALDLETANAQAVVEDADAALGMVGEEKNADDRSGMLFLAALGKALIGTSNDWEQTARRFLQTDHKYVPYIAMILYSRLVGEAKEEAHDVLQDRLSNADRAHWPERLRGGDMTAWREMLTAYYLKQVDRAQIFPPLENDAAFAKSNLQFLPSPRIGLICEAYFYDALLAEAEGNKSLMHQDLQKVLNNGRKSDYEYSMAKFLLVQQDHSSARAAR